MKCTDCGYELESPMEYHPPAFCVLVKAGYNPLTVVLDAVSQLVDLGGDVVHAEDLAPFKGGKCNVIPSTELS